MLGKMLYDPEKVESSITEMPGLGLLPMTTVFAGAKETHRVRGQVAQDSGLLAGAKGLPGCRGTKYTWAGLPVREWLHHSSSKTGLTRR